MFALEEILQEFVDAAELPPRKIKIGDALHDSRWRSALQSKYERSARRKAAAAVTPDPVTRIPCACGGYYERRPGTTQEFHIGGYKSCKAPKRR